jgi:hypothetical protein
MESIFKMVILHLSIKPTIFKFWILIENYIRINETFEFFDSLCIRSEIELGLGPSQIIFYLNHISSLFEDFSDPS